MKEILIHQTDERRKVSVKNKESICEIRTQKFSDKMGPVARHVYASGTCRSVHFEKEYKKGELIFGPYDTENRVFEIGEGEVEIYQLSLDGKKVIIDILAPGAIFANSPFSFEPGLDSNDFALARSRVVMRVLQKSDFLNWLKIMPEMAVSLVGQVSTKLTEADDRIRDLALSDARTRLVNELMRFGRKWGKELENEIVMGTRLTHEELAAMTGLTRETVSRELKRLRHDEVVGLDRHKHIVVDKNEVKKIFCQ